MMLIFVLFFFFYLQNVYVSSKLLISCVLPYVFTGLLHCRLTLYLLSHQGSPINYCVCVSRLVMFNSSRLYGLQPTRLLSPWDFPGKNTGVGCHFFLQRIFLTQRLNQFLLHCRQVLYHLSHQGSSNYLLIINS